jgi:hypothetical protein
MAMIIIQFAAITFALLIGLAVLASCANPARFKPESWCEKNLGPTQCQKSERT